MLQEVHIWNRERQARWSEIREKGSLSYVLKMVGIAFFASVAIAGLYSAFSVGSNIEFHLATAFVIPLFGIISGVIWRRASWRASEESFKKMKEDTI